MDRNYVYLQFLRIYDAKFARNILSILLSEYNGIIKYSIFYVMTTDMCSHGLAKYLDLEVDEIKDINQIAFTRPYMPYNIEERDNIIILSKKNIILFAMSLFIRSSLINKILFLSIIFLYVVI